MAYQVLARKWRPQDFSSVVGQESIVIALRNALTEGRLAQAYLFAGIRGVGKTSVARVLAKSLNCERGPAADPCNDCLPCREITDQADLDVIEMDAATHSKVEQVRDLTESLRYSPARDRYKVVVIDEIHRLSRQAFDALLKIVEEPPPHLVFIFATTEIEAVPATILSRCQEYHFRRVPSAVLIPYLRQICEAEAIDASDTALRLIARAGEGSVRDAVALLDQLATFGSGRIPEKEAARILGGVDAALFHRLLEAILAGDGGAVTSIVAEVEREGRDPRSVYTQFVSYCRSALHLALPGDRPDVDLPREEAESLEKLAAPAGYENVLRLLHQLLSSEAAVRRSELGSLALEIALLRAAELPKLVRIEELLGRAPETPGPRSATGRRRESRVIAAEAEAGGPASGGEEAPGSGATAEAATGSPQSEDRGDGGGKEATGPTAAEEAPARAADEEVRAAAGIAALLEHLSRSRPGIAAHLEEAEELVYRDGQLLIYLTPGDDWLAKTLGRAKNRAVLESALIDIWGEGVRWRLIEGSGKPAAPAPQTGDDEDQVIQHPTVQTVLDVFGGSVEQIEDPRRPRKD